jgi:hypothetical protein
VVLLKSTEEEVLDWSSEILLPVLLFETSDVFPDELLLMVPDVFFSSELLVKVELKFVSLIFDVLLFGFVSFVSLLSDVFFSSKVLVEVELMLVSLVFDILGLGFVRLPLDTVSLLKGWVVGYIKLYYLNKKSTSFYHMYQKSR